MIFNSFLQVDKGIYFPVLNIHGLQVCYSLVFAFSFGFCFQSETKPFTVQSEQTCDPPLVNLTALFPQFPICYFSCWIILLLPVNPAAISSNHTFNKVLSGAQALILPLTCCHVIALTQTNSIYGPICWCLLSPACIAPSRLHWLSALFDSTHGGQNFRGHHASDLAQNEIDVCWTERSGWGWHTSSMPRLFLPSDSYFIVISAAFGLVIFQGDKGQINHGIRFITIIQFYIYNTIQYI